MRKRDYMHLFNGLDFKDNHKGDTYTYACGIAKASSGTGQFFRMKAWSGVIYNPIIRGEVAMI